MPEALLNHFQTAATPGTDGGGLGFVVPSWASHFATEQLSVAGLCGDSSFEDERVEVASACVSRSSREPYTLHTSGFRHDECIGMFCTF